MQQVFIKDETIEKEIEKNLIEALKNDNFKKLVSKLKLTKEEAKVNVSKLEQTLEEIENSKKNHALNKCPNSTPGYILIPEKKEGRLYYYFTPCSCRKKIMKSQEIKNDIINELDNIGLKDIDLTDKSRTSILKWINKFYKEYDYETSNKGLYLSGSFGSGKTFIIHALFNELRVKKEVDGEAIYYPELLRELKEDWELYAYKMNRLQKVPLLLIDDIGAEKVTEWGRDEVLGTILQTRMNMNLPTFFTSNLSVSELERHLATTGNNIDNVKAKRIIQRIMQVSEELELISANRRK